MKMWKNKEREINRKELTIEEMKGFVDAFFDLQTHCKSQPVRPCPFSDKVKGNFASVWFRILPVHS